MRDRVRACVRWSEASASDPQSGICGKRTPQRAVAGERMGKKPSGSARIVGLCRRHRPRQTLHLLRAH
jgi:hypothetical protein